MAQTKPDLALVDAAVPAKVADAMRKASVQLKSLGIRHALVGGLAVVAHGYARNTRDVDFLVGPEAFVHHEGGLVTLQPGVPIQIAGVAVDLLSATEDEPHLEAALAETIAGAVPLAPVTTLAYLKLKSPRQKDLADLVELVKAGVDAEVVAAHLRQHAPGLLEKWDRVVATARVEE